MRLDGRVAMVTGAGKGIGTAIASAFAREVRGSRRSISTSAGAESVAASLAGRAAR